MKERCDCTKQEDEQRLTITIKRVGKELEVAAHGRTHNESHSVRPKSTCAIAFGRSYEDLEKLGEGDHEICRCHSAGPEDVVFRQERKPKGAGE